MAPLILRRLFFLLGLLPLLGLLAPARASHIRAGDIQVKTDTTAARNPLRVFCKMVTYNDPTSGANHQLDDVYVYFGDNTRAQVPRASHVNIGNNIYRDIYYFEHTYNAPGRYVISHVGELRADAIRNIPFSNTRSFYIGTQITIDPLLGVNRSPVLNAPAVDRATSGQVFLHNPAASDADGDSLAFKLLICQYEPRAASGITQPSPLNLPGYTYPEVASGGVQVPFPGPPVGQPGQAARLDLNERDGLLVWNAPNLQGDYNVAFKVEEWRRDAFGARRKLGEVIRDMQITVAATNNTRPTVLIPRDTCVVAGTSLVRNVRATDPDNHNIRLTAFGGVLPPATFVQTLNQPGRAAGRFSWSTSCTDVASDPHIIVFRAEDQPAAGVSLVDIRPWLVTVVGPPPTNLQARLQAGNRVQLTWDRYFCQNATRILIYRKVSSSAWRPGDCETGIPARAGYTQVGAVAANLATFLDDNGGRGLARGQTYCYRIYAEFPRPAGGASIASQEACLPVPGRSMQFTNVTVDRTDAVNGQITVRWTKPAPAAAFPAPAGYRLSRGVGLPPTTYTPVRTFTNLDDTVHVDPGLNTLDHAYTYRLDFFFTPAPGAPETVESAGPASSVRTEIIPNPGPTSTIEVRWRHDVPWDNAGSRTRIYRKVAGAPAYSLLTATATSTASGGSFIDRDPALRLNTTYCYYVETEGGYPAPSPLVGLRNLSQEQCVPLMPRLCRPVLTLQGPDCERLGEQARQYPSPLPRPLTYTNTLSWTLSSLPTGCHGRVVEYRVLYSPACDSTAFQEIGRTATTSFSHGGLSSAAGCYRVLAVDSAGVTAASNIAQGDNCRVFVLPNIFTPDNDQRNDVFRPLFASPVVGARVKIFNRWGAQVFEGKAGTDLTLWDGGGARSAESGGRDTGAKAAAGTYYYHIEVEFADRAHSRQVFKSWVEIVR
ncbi:gliding motility-associated C-terminal domain-containing protein [Hymenobacter gummosus]|nr:gliding motility-associated C-terminal domain-containing protein [Hymenobacter gummosus]